MKKQKDKFQITGAKHITSGRTLCCTVLGFFNLFAIPSALAAANIFADIPLHLQSKSITTSSYSVKPNVTFYIDDSGSMSMNIVPITYKCRVSKWIPNPDGKGGKWPPFGSYEYGFTKKPKNTSEVRYSCDTYRRIDSVKEVLTDIIKKYHDDMYFAFRPMCGTGDQKKFNKFYDTSDPANYESMLNNIKKLETPCDTPTTRQFPVIARNLVINKLKYRCQKSYIILLSDGEADNTYSISDKNFTKNTDSRYDSYFDRDFETNNDRLNFLARNHNTNKPLRLKYYTDRLNNYNFGDYIYTSDYYSSTGKSINASPVRKKTDDAGQPWNEVDPKTKKRFRQTAQTFTIGVGLGQRNTNEAKIAIPYLENAATPSGEYNETTNPDGRFFNANSRDEIISAFEKIFKTIKGEMTASTIQTTTTAPTVAISNTNLSNLSITAKVETGSWSSRICIYDINTKNDSSSCPMQPTYGNRQLLLNDGKYTHLFNESLNSFNNSTFKISNNNKNRNEWYDGLLAWLNRSLTADTQKKNEFVLDYRTRRSLPDFGNTRDLGDIIDNPILTAGNIENNRQRYLITSANDGMVYVFRSSNNSNFPYDLKFNYMPMGIERQSNDGSDLVAHYYKDLTSKKYGANDNFPHRFLLNGGMTVQQTDGSNGRPQQIFMVSTLGQAGRGAFAINIGGYDIITGRPLAGDNMQSPSWYEDVFLFQTPSGKNNQFGYTVGTPAIARVRVNSNINASDSSITDHIRQAAFISNGYNYSPSLAQDITAKPSPESALYIYDILGIDVGTQAYTHTGSKKGDLIAKLVAPNGSGGLSSPTVIDINGDGVADIVYAGDYQGNLYRFDLRAPNPSKWKVYKIFTADGPITSAPGVFLLKAKGAQHTNSEIPTAIVTFGTGSDIYQSDLTNKDQQSVYGIYDDLSQPEVHEISKSSLVKQEFIQKGDYRLLSDYQLNPAVHRGWYFQLKENTGERVVSKPVIVSYAGAVLSRTYNVEKENKLPDPCKITSVVQRSSVTTGKIQFNVKTGGALQSTDPNFVFDETAPAGSSVSTEGSFSFTVSGNNNIDIGGSYTQKPLTEKSPPVENCSRAAVIAATTDGNKLTINVPRCPIIIHRISWREIKESYINL